MEFETVQMVCHFLLFFIFYVEQINYKWEDKILNSNCFFFAFDQLMNQIQKYISQVKQRLEILLCMK